jgi:hypothetical protein
VRNNRTLVALIVALMLVVPGLGCAVYGALLHTQVVAPPTLKVEIGSAHLIGGVYPPMCETAPHCTTADMAYEPRRTYRAWLFIHIADAQIIQVARIKFLLP